MYGKNWMRSGPGDLLDIEAAFVPERFRTLRSWGTWGDFISDSIFYHPPEEDLVGFADHCGGGLSITFPPGWRNGKDQELVAMLEAPIEELRDADRVQDAWMELYFAHRGLLDEINERFLKPRGLDLDALMADVLKDVSSPFDRFARQLEEISKDKRPYIRVDEHTTKHDVEYARRVLTASQATRPGAGAPKYSRLLCVQYAILHDKHGWRTKQIAERFEGRTDQTTLRRFNDHIKIGRDLLGNS